jgi:signal transduction histidine kinase
MMDSATDNNVTREPAKILVIDDQESARALLKRRLSIHGYEVLPAANAEQALDILSKKRTDAIFLNMFISGISSYDFLLDLKENELYKNIPVIMISSNDDVELVVKCIEAGAEDYLVKPLNQTLLKARLSNCIAKKEAYDKEIAYLAKIEQGQKQIASQEKMAALGTLISSVSQELKNPLNFVINFAEVSSETCDELLKQIAPYAENLSTESYNFLSNKLNNLRSNVTKISEYGKNADKIIRFMLDQSSTSGGKKYPTNVNKVISQTIIMLLAAYKTNGITKLPTVDTDFDEAIPHIPISIQSFSKAIYNILDNSMFSVINKYDNISNAKISITTEATSSSLKISIYDNGGGIKEDIKDKIFEPFFTTKPEGSTGSGLGLSTAKEVVDEHRGNLSVQSIEGDYAKFTILIPQNSDAGD